MNKAIDRHAAFWILYAMLSLAALVFAIKLFPAAIPLVNLDIKMSRAEALRKAEAVAAKFGLAPRARDRPHASSATRRRRTTSSWRAAASRRSARWSVATCTRRTHGT
jgi:hypothetical protein